MKKPIFDKLDFDILVGFYTGFDSLTEINELLAIKKAVPRETVRRRVEKLLSEEFIEVKNKKIPNVYRKYKVTEKAQDEISNIIFFINIFK